MAYRTILVASDLSEASREALAAGTRLASEGSRVHLLHVLPRPDLLSGLPSEERLALEEAWDAAREAAGLQLQRLSGARGVERAEVRTTTRSAAAVIAEEAERLAADLVVVGSTGQARATLGSTARAVARAARCGVLITRRPPQPPPGPPFRAIGVATDFTSRSEAAVEAGLALSAEPGVRLFAIHAVDPSIWAVVTMAGGGTGPEPASLLERRAERSLADLVAGPLRGRAEARVLRGPAAKAVASLAQRERLDLVVVGASRRGGADRLLLGGVAESVMERCPCSVLVAR